MNERPRARCRPTPMHFGRQSIVPTSRSCSKRSPRRAQASPGARDSRAQRVPR
ncbi:hypothetical protein AKJ09_00511 [Labilithrix luteola]|uniref:Uncharacterized protein n=1 Tax=Labilithrix luteola TaxID=1391654 RepID=A0A0K1PK05_9BACT|nr:hypothetical protein AKJ09_00511 [Labilithrix luteola]